MYHTQCHSVKYPTLCAALQASDTPSNIKRDILSGPQSLLVLSNGTINGTQGKKHGCNLMDHGGSNTTTGHHLRYMIDAHKL